jgi:RHS repeat-associated protein
VFFDDLIITHTKGKVLQEDHYYPFGATINALSSSAPLSKPNRYKLSGNEEQVDFDWNVYDFNARQYDPQLGRFMQVDPMADAQESWNPYHYSYNNPLLFVDPTGLLPKYNWDTEEYEDDDGNVISWQDAFAAHGIGTGQDGDGWMPESESGYNGKPKVKIWHSSGQEVINALTGYFGYLSENGQDRGNLGDVFDFNFYRRKGSITRWMNRNDPDFQEWYVNDAWATHGQGLLQHDGYIEDKRAKAMVMATMNESWKKGYKWLAFNFDESIYFTSEEDDRRIIGNKVVNNASLRFQRVTPSGVGNSSEAAIIINFYSNEARNAFYNKYIKNKGKKPAGIPLDRTKF